MKAAAKRKPRQLAVATVEQLQQLAGESVFEAISQARASAEDDVVEWINRERMMGRLSAENAKFADELLLQCFGRQ